MTTKVLITGIAGFIGSHLAEQFSKRKYDVFGMDDLSTGNMDNLRQAQSKVQEVVTHSVVNPYAVNMTFNKFKPDVVVHLAAQPSLLTSQKTPEYDATVNIIGTINILRACEEYDVSQLIFSSTSAITRSPVVQETFDPMKLMLPESPYGTSKRSAEHYVRLLMPHNSVVLRFANIYGPRQVPLGENQLIPRIIRHLMFDDEFSIFGDGTQTRDYTYVKDVAKLIVKIIEKGKVAPYPVNVGTGELTSVNEVVDTVLRIAGEQKEIKHTPDKDGRNRVKLVVEKAYTLYRWKAKTQLQTGIEKTWNWWKQYESESTHTGESDTRD